MRKAFYCHNINIWFFYIADDYSEANILRDKVRILCMVMTIHDGHYWKSKYLKDTWGERCNKLLFMSDINDPRISAVKVDVEPGRDHLTAKTMKSFEMAYRKYSKEYNWFLKADDDTYIIVENLRYLLSTHSADEPVYFGHHFQFQVDQGSYCNIGCHPKSILNSTIEKTFSSITSIFLPNHSHISLRAQCSEWTFKMIWQLRNMISWDEEFRWDVRYSNIFQGFDSI